MSRLRHYNSVKMTLLYSSNPVKIKLLYHSNLVKLTSFVTKTLSRAHYCFCNHLVKIMALNNSVRVILLNYSVGHTTSKITLSRLACLMVSLVRSQQFTDNNLTSLTPDCYDNFANITRYYDHSYVTVL